MGTPRRKTAEDHVAQEAADRREAVAFRWTLLIVAVIGVSGVVATLVLDQLYAPDPRLGFVFLP